MSPSAISISVEEYLTTSYRPDCDYVDGVVLERNLGEFDYSRLQALLTIWLGSRESQWGVRVLTEQRVQVSSTRFRIPDVCVINTERERILRKPPLICIEILSEEDRMSLMQQRIDDYLKFGVRYVWVIDPTTRKAYAHTTEGMREAKDGILRAENPDIALLIAKIFAEME
jgi:Uma2 family endonuclease